jgi:hypothetical protein
MIIGFTEKTSSILAKIFCKKFRHCAVIFDEKINNNEYFIFVHIGPDMIKLINITSRDIGLLEKNGWTFINTGEKKRDNFSFFTFHFSFLTCVGFAKRALGINKPFIWTPDQLYKYLANPRNRDS